MKTSIFKVVALFSILSVMIGCGTTTGMISGSTGTGIKLDHGNYRVIKAGARGQDWGFWLLFFPLSMPSYADAKQRLYASVGESLDGKAAALANQTIDKPFFTLIAFTWTRVILTADVIEFIDVQHGSSPAQPKPVPAASELPPSP